jgi:hypothetical protein
MNIDSILDSMKEELPKLIASRAKEISKEEGITYEEALVRLTLSVEAELDERGIKIDW